MGRLLITDDMPPATCEYITTVAQSATNVSQPLDIGTPVDGMCVAVIINYSVAASQSGHITAADIDGTVAEILAQGVYDSGGGATEPGVAIIAAQLSPLSSNIVVTLTTTATITAVFSSYRVLNLESTSAIAADSDAVFGPSASVSLDTVDDGIILSGISVVHSGTTSISGITQDYNFTGASTYRFGGSDLTSVEVGRTVSVTRLSGPDPLVAIAAASLR